MAPTALTPCRSTAFVPKASHARGNFSATVQSGGKGRTPRGEVLARVRWRAGGGRDRSGEARLRAASPRRASSRQLRRLGAYGGNSVSPMTPLHACRCAAPFANLASQVGAL